MWHADEPWRKPYPQSKRSLFSPAAPSPTLLSHHFSKSQAGKKKGNEMGKEKLVTDSKICTMLPQYVDTNGQQQHSHTVHFDWSWMFMLLIVQMRRQCDLVIFHVSVLACSLALEWACTNFCGNLINNWVVFWTVYIYMMYLFVCAHDEEGEMN